MKRNISLIGSVIKVIGSDNKELIGIFGRVINETKNTITVDSSKKRIKLLKSEIVFKIGDDEFSGKDCDGDIVFRLKKNAKKISKIRN